MPGRLGKRRPEMLIRFESEGAPKWIDVVNGITVKPDFAAREEDSAGQGGSAITYCGGRMRSCVKGEVDEVAAKINQALAAEALQVPAKKGLCAACAPPSNCPGGMPGTSGCAYYQPKEA